MDQRLRGLSWDVRLTLQSINAELAKRGSSARLEKGVGYFYFSEGDAADWLDRTVNVPSLSTLTLEQWVDQFERLKKLNDEILQRNGKKGRTQGSKPSPNRGRSKR